MVPKLQALAAFTSSGVLRHRLKDLQSILNPASSVPLRLIHPVDTRFNSKFDSLERVLILRNAIETALGTDSHTAQEFAETDDRDE